MAKHNVKNVTILDEAGSDDRQVAQMNPEFTEKNIQA